MLQPSNEESEEEQPFLSRWLSSPRFPAYAVTNLHTGVRYAGQEGVESAVSVKENSNAVLVTATSRCL